MSRFISLAQRGKREHAATERGGHLYGLKFDFTRSFTAGKSKSRFVRYSVAALLIGTAFACQLAMAANSSLNTYPFIVFYPALFFVALFCGTGPGFCATVAAAIAGRYFFMEPLRSFLLPGPISYIPLAIFFSMGLLINWMSHMYRLAATELVVARGHADRANTAKSAFLANMSHEIRTPLAAIIGFTDLLRNPELALQERETYVAAVLRNGKSLGIIIDDILDLAKVEAGKIEIEEVELSIPALIHEVIEMFLDAAKSKNLYLRSSVSSSATTSILSDPTRIRQILVNLIGNALKFTSAGGIEIVVNAKTKADGRLEIRMTVNDSGIGLSGEQLGRLFEPFAQADNTTTRRFGGTGLGLALSRRLANILGGELRAESAGLDCGSSFVFSFDTIRVAEATSAASRESLRSTGYPERGLQGLNILLADDSPDNRFLVERMLRKNGAEVGTAVDGVAAYDRALDGSFDLVLMDMQMPKLDGYEGTKALRASGFSRPIIALTAHAMVEERARSLAAGCNEHLVKPIAESALIEAILQAVGRI